MGLRLHLAGTNGGPREPHEMESASETKSPAGNKPGVSGSRTAKRAPKQFRLGTGGRDTLSEGRLLGGGAPRQEARRNLCVGVGRKVCPGRRCPKPGSLGLKGWSVWERGCP